MKKRILVVEDDDFLMNVYRVKLEKLSFEVLIAKDGEEALQIVNESAPDLIVLDLLMPKKDGFEFLRELKSLPQRANIPVMIVTNLGQQEDIDLGFKLGASDFIIKSNISLDNLIEKIRAHIQPAPVQPAPQVPQST